MMHRYRIYFSTLVAATLPLFSAVSAEYPNIVILYADDMGYGDVQANYSESKIPTPHLDKLAAEGMRFTDGHSSCGVCTPSRYALLTGKYHWRKFYDIVLAYDDSVFDDEELTMPEMLQARGYYTAAIGKWHLGMNWSALIDKTVPRVDSKAGRKSIQPKAFDWSKPIPNGPNAHGFDYYFGDETINFPPYVWIENDRVLQAADRIWDPSVFRKPKEGGWGGNRPGPQAPDWNPYENIPMTTQKAVELIHQQAKTAEPFFLYFAFPSPHGPIIPNKEFEGKSEAGPYGDYVYETDDACGQILKALEESGQSNNTVVVFSTDNGAAREAMVRDVKYGHWSSGPYRGLKKSIYEGGHRVPFLVKWPGVTEAGSVSDALVSQIDLMATFAAAVGYDLPNDQAHDSFNLLPVLGGKSANVRNAHVHNTDEGEFAIRGGDWVLVNVDFDPRKNANKKWMARHGYPTTNVVANELYHLKRDPGQRANLAAQHPEKVKILKSLLKNIREQGYSAPHIKD